MKTLIHFLMLSMLLIACNGYNANQEGKNDLSLSSQNPQKHLQRIAFGSCNNQNLPQEMWPFVLQNDPDLWIWLGDNVYADTEHMAYMRALYDQQKEDSAYRALWKTTPVIGTWDDHDYGVNDGGQEFSMRKESKNLLMKFLDVSEDNPVWQHEGAYNAYTFGEGAEQVKVLLLDARYFRDSLQIDPSGEKRYIPRENGTILGEAQWTWLENELTTSKAKIHLIACGIQMIPAEHGFEKWANFPHERQRLFDLIAKTKVANPILLSGDRHIAEISKLEQDGFPYPIYEVTSSGLTHTWSESWEESNQYRIGELIIKKNFGLLSIDWDSKQISLQVRGLENTLFGELQVPLI